MPSSNDHLIEILPATSEERNWAVNLMSTSEPWLTLGTTEEQHRLVCHDPQYHLWVAHINDTPCGLIILHPRGLAGSPYIKSIAVTAGYRGRGIGTQLIHHAENLFRPYAKHIFLCVSSFNRAAFALYQQLGYRQVGEFKDYVMEGASEILLHKRLR